MLPETGNIYRDRFSYEGKSYVDYSVDCSVCGREVAIFLSSRDGKTCKKWLKNKGWRKHPEHRKWVCHECCSNLTPRAPDLAKRVHPNDCEIDPETLPGKYADDPPSGLRKPLGTP